MNVPCQKRKITQNDLRQMMTEKKRKLIETKRKIDSPLAKFLSDGTLICIICNSAIKSETIWHIHINSKQHRDNITRKKQTREKFTVEFSSQNSDKNVITNAVDPPKLKGILKNKQFEEPVVFARTDAFILSSPPSVNNEDANSQMEIDADVDASNNKLPEGFFDDPIMDAKARNVDYKDPIDEEMERFQREIQEENLQLEQMLDQDQQTAAADKEIEYIDEHIQLWSRMQTLEEKIENTRKLASERKNLVPQPMHQNDDEDSSYGSEEEFDEYIDWRSKRSFK